MFLHQDLFKRDFYLLSHRDQKARRHRDSDIRLHRDLNGTVHEEGRQLQQTGSGPLSRNDFVKSFLFFYFCSLLHESGLSLCSKKSHSEQGRHEIHRCLLITLMFTPDYYKLMQDFTEPDVSIQFEIIMK